MREPLTEESLHALAKVLVGAEIQSDFSGRGRIEELIWQEGEPYWRVDFGPTCKMVVMVRACIGSLLEDYEKSMEK